MISMARRAHRGCYYCGGAFNYDDPDSDRYPTREHRTPKSLGGDNRRNVVIACKGCNNEKGRMTVAEFAVYRDATAGISGRTMRRLHWEKFKNEYLVILNVKADADGQ